MREFGKFYVSLQNIKHYNNEDNIRNTKPFEVVH